MGEDVGREVVAEFELDPAAGTDHPASHDELEEASGGGDREQDEGGPAGPLEIAGPQVVDRLAQPDRGGQQQQVGGHDGQRTHEQFAAVATQVGQEAVDSHRRLGVAPREGRP